jgi:hypothetical protein
MGRCLPLEGASDVSETTLDARALAYAIPEAEYARLLRLPVSRLSEERFSVLAAQARAWYAEKGRPWVGTRQVALRTVEETSVHLETDMVFSGPALSERLKKAQAHAIIAAAVSAGPEVAAEVDRLWKQDRPDEAFFLHAMASAVTEYLILQTRARLCSENEPLGWAVTPHLCPGHDGWDLRDQPALGRLLGAGKTGFPLDVLPSGMLRPVHSVLAVFGLTSRKDLVEQTQELCPCEGCSFSPCVYRRRPYRNGASRCAPRLSETPVSGRYGYPEKALRRWAKSLLTLDHREDGVARGRFRFDGSTCTNGGIPLAFEYEVELSPSTDGRRLLSMTCRPVSKNTGYEAMCSVRENEAAFWRALSAETPFLGHPLAEALDWNPPTNPAACLCTSENRDHKWRMVLHTLHYALSRSNEGRLPQRSPAPCA